MARYSTHFLPVLVFLTFLFLPRPAHAILDVEVLRMKLEDQPYGGVVALTYDRKEGNTDVNRLTVDSQGIWKFNDIESLAMFSRAFGESSGVKDTDHTVGHLRFTYPASQSHSFETYGQLEQDQFRRLSDRELAGVGARERLFNSKEFKMFVGFGPMWSQETLTPAVGATDDGSYTTWRANIYFSLTDEVMQNVTLSVVSYYQPVMSNLQDNRILNDTELTFEANSRLSLSLVYQLTYESRPAQLVLPTDQDFCSTIKLKF